MDSNKINNKLKTRIAISKVCEEDIVMNKEKSIFLKNLGITSMALVLTSGICFASVKLINAFGPNSSTGSQEAIQNGYVEYVKDDSLVDSFMLDNYIVKAIMFIKRKKYDDAVGVYKEMVYYLKDNYKLNNLSVDMSNVWYDKNLNKYKIRALAKDAKIIYY